MMTPSAESRSWRAARARSDQVTDLVSRALWALARDNLDLAIVLAEQAFREVEDGAVVYGCEELSLDRLIALAALVEQCADNAAQTTRAKAILLPAVRLRAGALTGKATERQEVA